MFLSASDVITVHGTVLSTPPDTETVAMLNLMGHLTSLPARIEQDLMNVSRTVTHRMRAHNPIVQDIVTMVRKSR